MNIVESHIVPEEYHCARIEDFILHAFTTFYSRKGIKKALKRGELSVDGDKIVAGSSIKAGQSIIRLESSAVPPRMYRLRCAVPFEDPYLAVVEKPAGLRTNGNQFRTLENALRYNLEESHCQDRLGWPRPVHRLDSAVGGLVICAKTSQAMVDLGRQFQQRQVTKRYRAIVTGRLDGSGIIKTPINEKDALTRYTSVYIAPSLKNQWLTLVDLHPETGREHQLRRHLSGKGFPILGDQLYGMEGNILKGKGVFLWAVELRFRHPVIEEPITVMIDEPNKFAGLMAREKKRWERFKAAEERIFVS